MIELIYKAAFYASVVMYYTSITIKCSADNYTIKYGHGKYSLVFFYAAIVAKMLEVYVR